MSISTLVKKYEDELVAIDGKIAALEERKKLVKLFLSEFGKVSAAPKRPARKRKARKATAPKKPRRAKGNPTVKDAILKAVADAGGPLTSAEIITAAAKLSSGAKSSIQSQITHLATAGDLAKVKHEGRGFKYTTGKSTR